MPPENKTLQQKTKNGFEIADRRLRELEAVARRIEEQLLEMVDEAMQAFATLRTRQNEIICRIEEMEATQLAAEVVWQDEVTQPYGEAGLLTDDRKTYVEIAVLLGDDWLNPSWLSRDKRYRITIERIKEPDATTAPPAAPAQPDPWAEDICDFDLPIVRDDGDQ